MLDTMAESLRSALKTVGFFLKIFKTISITSTTLELTLNALIMAISNIPSAEDLASDVVAIFAAINAVLKGLDMKLDIDTKQSLAQTAHGKFSQLYQTVKDKQLELNN